MSTDLMHELDTMMEVGQFYAQGHSIADIASRLDITRNQVKKYHEQFQKHLKRQAEENRDLTDRFMEIMSEVEHQYKLVSDEAWQNKRNADVAENYSASNTALKIIADLQKSRFAMYKEAGLSQDADLAAEMVETQRRQEILIEILKAAAKRFPDASRFIHEELSRIVESNDIIEVPDV